MKKIKFLILALLGITIIPTATNAYDIVNKFNGNYGLLYKEYRGSILYRCPYTSNIDLGANPSWQATSSSFPCIPGQNFGNGYNRGQFGEGRFVDINQDVVQYITAIKKKDGNYLPIGVNLQRKFGKFQVEHKNGTVYYDEVKTSNPYQYEVNLKSYDGRYGQLLGGLFLDGLLIKGYSRENGNVYDPGYKTVVVLDTDTWMGYKFDTNISLKEALDTSFISLFYSLYNSSPRGCYQMGIFYWQYSALGYSFSFKNDCPEFDIKQKLEKSLTISQGMRKLFKEESPYYDPNYKVNKILGEVPETTAPSANSAEAYNQCLAYYNSVKTYASYDRNCYKDLLDMNQDIGLRQQITDWDGEGEGPATDNRICNLWKGYKKSYKTKFKDKWSEFLELSSANRLSPHSLNVKDYCGEKPRDDDSLIKKIADGYRDAVLAVSKKVFNPKIRDAVFKVIDVMSFGLISPEVMHDKSDMIADSIFNLGFGYEEIHGEKGEVVTVSEIYADREELYELERKMNDPNLTPEERLSYQTKYNEKKQKVMKKYENFSGTGIVASTLGSGFKQGDFKVKSSNLFKKYYEGVLDSFNRGKSVVNFTNSCSGGFFSEINIFVYFFMILIGFYIFNLLK